MTFALRASQPADFETLWRIDQACFPPEQAYSRGELSHYMGRRGAFTLIAEEQTAAAQSDIVGFIVAEASSRGYGHIITIDVVTQARRAGVGSSLLQVAESRLRAASCRTVFLETAVDNHAALLFYKRHGYYVERTIPRYYNGSLDAFRLRKDLLPPTAGG